MRRYLALVPFALAAVICGQALPPAGQDPLVVGKGFASADGGNVTGNLSVSGSLSLGGTLSGTGLSSGSGTGTFNGFTSSDGGTVSGALDFPWAAPTALNDAGVTWPTTYQGRLVTRSVSKMTFGYEAGAGVASTQKDYVVGTFPAKTRLSAAWFVLNTNFTGGAVSAATFYCGTSAGGTELLTSSSVFSGAPRVQGDTASEQGTSVSGSTLGYEGGQLNWTAGGSIFCRLQTTTANISALTAGSLDLYVVTERYE